MIQSENISATDGPPRSSGGPEHGGETLKKKMNFEIFRSRGTKCFGGREDFGYPVHIRVCVRTYVERNAKGAELRLNKTVMTVAGDWGAEKIKLKPTPRQKGTRVVFPYCSLT